MTWFIAIIAFILILGLVILVHELGHFITAKKSGIKVEEFGIGFPPRLFAFKRGETVYSLNLIPIGGFTKMLGEEDPSHPGSLAGKSVRTRLLVLSAGSIMNLLLPILLLSIAFMIPRQVIAGGDLQVIEVNPGSPAAMAVPEGIQKDDIILTANGQRVSNFDEFHQIIEDANRDKQPVPIGLERDGEPIETTVNPPYPDDRIGVTMKLVNPFYETESYPIGKAIAEGFRQTWNIISLTVVGLFNLITGQGGVDVVGPVGIAQATGEVAKLGVASLLIWAAILSAVIGIMNLLPIPMLDGGRICFVLLEWVRRGKRISPEREKQAHLVGLMLLLTLVLVVSYFDLSRLLGGESILP
jgi:regulator of sigma E protease